jgi:hypothetical protein
MEIKNKEYKGKPLEIIFDAFDEICKRLKD